MQPGSPLVQHAIDMYNQLFQKYSLGWKEAPKFGATFAKMQAADRRRATAGAGGPCGACAAERSASKAKLESLHQSLRAAETEDAALLKAQAQAPLFEAQAKHFEEQVQAMEAVAAASAWKCLTSDREVQRLSTALAAVETEACRCAAELAVKVEADRAAVRAAHEIEVGRLFEAEEKRTLGHAAAVRDHKSMVEGLLAAAKERRVGHEAELLEQTDKADAYHKEVLLLGEKLEAAEAAASTAVTATTAAATAAVAAARRDALQAETAAKTVAADSTQKAHTETVLRLQGEKDTLSKSLSQAKTALTDAMYAHTTAVSTLHGQAAASAATTSAAAALHAGTLLQASSLQEAGQTQLATITSLEESLAHRERRKIQV